MNKLSRLQKIVFFLTRDAKIIKSQKDLMQKLGYKNESYMSQIINGRVPIPKDIGLKLKTVYPQLNLDWLENNIGTMLISGAGEPAASPQITIGDGNVAAHGQSNINVNPPADYIDLVRETQRQTAEMQKQSAEVLRQTAKMQDILINLMDKLNT